MSSAGEPTNRCWGNGAARSQGYCDVWSIICFENSRNHGLTTLPRHQLDSRAHVTVGGSLAIYLRLWQHNEPLSRMRTGVPC